jgi:uncharacterized protein (DUF4415 family)
MNVNRKNIGMLPSDRPPLTDADGEVRELTEEDFEHFRPSSEAIPELIEAFARMRGMRGSQRTPVKERVGLRLDANVVEHFRSSGSGWQSRVNEILKQHVAVQENTKGNVK